MKLMEVKVAFTKENEDGKLRNMILDLKRRWYTSPKDYGQALANRPRHAHSKGRRVLHTTNF